MISGVSLSPRSTRGYLRTSLRCKQESARYISDLDWFWFDYVKNLSLFFVFIIFLCNTQMGFSLMWRIKNAASKKSPVGKFPAHTGLSLSLSQTYTHWTNRRNGFSSFNSNSIWLIRNWGKGKENICFYLGPICNKISFSWFSNNESEIQIWLSFICYFYKPK